MKFVNYSAELEQRVLENLMHIGHHNNVRVQKAFLSLTSDCFYHHYNSDLFALIKQCFSKQEGFNFVDILILIPKSNDNLYKQFLWVQENYRNYHINDSSLENDVQKLIILLQLRQQVFTAEDTIARVKNCPDAYEAQSMLHDGIGKITNLGYQESSKGITGVQLAEEYYEGNLSKDLIIPTTCKTLNNLLGGGIRSKGLIIIAADSGVGKTGFGIFLMDAIARAQPDTQSLFFSLEMESKHIWMRQVGIRGGRQFDKMSDHQRSQAIVSACEVPVEIFDTASCQHASDLDFILTTARLKALQKPLSVIVVDYLGLVQNKGQFESNALRQTDITSKLAKLALELNCTVIALSQINRSASSRANDDRCPYPSDAADSSGGYRSSTLWFGVDRPEIYLNDHNYRNQFVVKCRKNRFGELFEMVFAFNEGTFAETQPGHFRKPYAQVKSIDHSLFLRESNVS